MPWCPLPPANHRPAPAAASLLRRALRLQTLDGALESTGEQEVEIARRRLFLFLLRGSRVVLVDRGLIVGLGSS